MNCPHHAQIYASKLRSCKELPIRYSETTMVYRDEQSGEIKWFIKDIIYKHKMMLMCFKGKSNEEESNNIWNMMKIFIQTFLDFPDLKVKI